MHVYPCIYVYVHMILDVDAKRAKSAQIRRLQYSASLRKKVKTPPPSYDLVKEFKDFYMLNHMKGAES